MGYCALTGPAVPQLAERFHITPIVYGAPALNYCSLAPGEPAAPPFHPPRA